MACVFSVLWGMHAGYLSNYLLGFLFLFRKVEYVLMCILAYQLIRDRDNGKTIIKIIDRTLPILMIIGFLQLTGHVGGFIQGYYAPDVSWRIPSTFSGPYEYSAYLVLITPIYLYRLIYNRKVLSSLIVLPMIFVSLYFTQARISIVAFGVILLLFFMFSRRMLYRSISISVIVIGCIFFLLSQSSSLSSILPERFSTVNISDMVLQTKIAMKQADFDRFLEYGYTVYNVGDDMSFSMRIGKWADMLDGFSRSPILGVGLSVTTEAVDGNYIRYLAESGILGFSLWLILIYRILKISKSIKTANKDLLLMKNAVFFGTFGLLVMAIFIDIFEASKIAMIYWFFIGVLIKLNSLQNEEERA